MKILTRHVVVSKSFEETTDILKSSAYYFPKANFSQTGFSMSCAKRYQGGIISLLSVKGTIRQQGHWTEVTLSLHADFGFYLGCILLLLGATGLIWCLVAPSQRWIPYLGMVLLGLFSGGQYLWEGLELLDRLERKLLR